MAEIQSNVPSEQTNPPTSTILATHTLASRTINQHNTPLAIFDADNLDYLRRWVSNNTAENRRALLLEKDALDDLGAELGTKANQRGSLVGYVMARYGVEGDVRTLRKDEVEALRAWFEGGGGR